MKRVIDPRLHDGPKLYRDQDTVRLSFKINTPFRIAFLDYNIVKPAALLWRVIFIILIIDLILWFVGVWSVFFNISIERGTVYLGMVLAYVLWQAEQASRYRLTRMSFGKRIRLRITREKVYVGRWLLRKSYDRPYQVTFGLQRFAGAKEPAYAQAHGFYLVIDDTTRVKLAEIFDPLTATQVVTCCNMALTLTNELEDYDVDPTERSA